MNRTVIAIVINRLVLPIVRLKCMLATLHIAACLVMVRMPTGQTDGRQIVTLCFVLDVAT